MKTKQLQNLIELSSNVKIYIPSTIDVNKKINNGKQVNDCLSFMSGLFGGATSFDAVGCWMSQTDGLVKEKVVICESFCNSDDLALHISSILVYCENLKKTMSQEAISLEINNKLYFV